MPSSPRRDQGGRRESFPAALPVNVCFAPFRPRHATPCEDQGAVQTLKLQGETSEFNPASLRPPRALAHQSRSCCKRSREAGFRNVAHAPRLQHAPGADGRRPALDTYAYGEMKIQFVYSCYYNTATTTCCGYRPLHDGRTSRRR
jgi:hypothetical protein